MSQLYLISPPSIALPDFCDALTQVLATGKVAAFQLRLKQADEQQIRKAVDVLMPICHRYEVPFILNDCLDIAVELGCDGVHLGQEDLEKWPIRQARERLSDTQILGITCHASKHLAMEAAEAGADYVAFGAFFPTTSKPKEKLEKWGTPEPEILRWWSDYTEIPCVAIGGIHAGNAKLLADTGADFIAVISSVWDHEGGAVSGVDALIKACNPS